MTELDPTEPTAAAGLPSAPTGRHRAVHQAVAAPPTPAWLPRAALAGGAVLALGLGVLATASAASTPTRHNAGPATASAAPAASGLARLSRNAPKGAKLLSAQPVHVSRPAPATPAAISGLAANGIPQVALNAYRLAAARLASAEPSCGIQWWLLAGIGRVESDHGRYGGARLTASGESMPHIVGDALDGRVYDYIADTDGGRLDGDPRFDHAVGPMQFIPSTWASYGIDGNGDRLADPFNVNDAALAAARYLCAAGGDLRTAAGQDRAVLAYNHSDQYLALVLGTAAAYASGTPVGTPIQGVTSGGLPPVDTSWLPPVNPGAPAGARTGLSQLGSPATLPPSRAGSGSGRSGGASAGTGSAGGTSSGTGSSGSGSTGPGSTGSGSTGNTGSAGSGSTGQPAPSSAAPAPAPASGSAGSPSHLTTPSLPLPLPTLSAVPLPSPTGSICTKLVLGVLVKVICPH
jgi:membrane-bound lytic murein transglycosylase B